MSLYPFVENIFHRIHEAVQYFNQPFVEIDDLNKSNIEDILNQIKNQLQILYDSIHKTMLPLDFNQIISEKIRIESDDALGTLSGLIKQIELKLEAVPLNKQSDMKTTVANIIASLQRLKSLDFINNSKLFTEMKNIFEDTHTLYSICDKN